MNRLARIFLFLFPLQAFCQDIEWVLKPKYDFDSVYFFHENRAAFKGKDGLWGFVDETGKVKSPVIYNYVANFMEGIAPVLIKDKWGYINKDGNLLIEPKYEIVSNFQDGLAQVFDGKVYMIDKKGKPLGNNKFDRLSAFNDGLAIATSFADKTLNPKKLKHGFINKQGELVIPMKYQYAQPFHEGLAVVYDTKFKYIDLKGREAFKKIKKYEWVGNFKEGKALVRLNNVFGYIDSAGNELIEPQYYDATDFDEGHALVVKKLRKKGALGETDYLQHGILSTNGSVRLLTGNYAKVEPYGRGLFLTEQKGKFSIIDYYEKIIGEQFYDEVGFLRDGNLKVRKGNYYGVIDLLGKEIVPVSFDEILNYEELPVVVKKNNKWFIYDENNKYQNSSFEDATCFSEGLAWVKQNGKWGIIRNPLLKPRLRSTSGIIWIEPKTKKTVTKSLLSAEIAITSELNEQVIKNNLNVFINGKLQTKNKLSPVSRRIEQTHYFTIPIELLTGENDIRIKVSPPNSESIESSTRLITYVPQNQSTLYLFSFGVQSDLKYTDKDAVDVYKLFKEQEGTTFKRIISDKPLIGKETTTNNIRIRLEQLSNNEDIQPQDVLIIFVSSHGIMIGDQFRIQGSDYDPNAKKSTTISFKDDFINNLNALNCKKIIILDACLSGGATKTSFYTDVNKLIADTPPGTAIITSSSGTQSSYEDDKYQNGIFTETLIRGLKNREADLNNDGRVYLSELKDYMQKEVSKLANSIGKQQNPQFRIDGFEDIIIYTY